MTGPAHNPMRLAHVRQGGPLCASAPMINKVARAVAKVKDAMRGPKLNDIHF